MTTKRSASNQEFSLWSKKEPPDQRENQRRKTFKNMMFQSTTSDTKSREIEHVRNWTSNTATAQFRYREGPTMSKWTKKSLNQHVERSEENPEQLQQGIGKVNQASQQEGTLEDQATMYVSTRSGSIRRTRALQTANQQTREVQGASKGRYLKLPNIARVALVRPRIVRHRSYNLDSDA